jgi:hypothetical protein
MFFGGGILALAAVLFWIYCIFDVISTDEALMRNMPKIVWLMVVIFLPTVGSVAWLVLGRPLNAGFTPGDTRYQRPPPRRTLPTSSPKGPEDSPDFMSGLDGKARELKKWEEDLKRREDELRRREDEGQ